MPSGPYGLIIRQRRQRGRSFLQVPGARHARPGQRKRASQLFDGTTGKPRNPGHGACIPGQTWSQSPR
ncbi:MAG: hypothetical protein F4Y87_03530 [Synechococcus sp. SB0665_bin_28]|nr:hypothetical protein [Synechococcus sp. SB0665_bin_28]MYF21013.1 hypothetical protein [Synechococcus sp. SB0677_bin_5]